jgi:hypothetical protein
MTLFPHIHFFSCTDNSCGCSVDSPVCDDDDDDDYDDGDDGDDNDDNNDDDDNDNNNDVYLKTLQQGRHKI